MSVSYDASKPFTPPPKPEDMPDDVYLSMVADQKDTWNQLSRKKPGELPVVIKPGVITRHQEWFGQQAEEKRKQLLSQPVAQPVTQPQPGTNAPPLNVGNELPQSTTPPQPAQNVQQPSSGGKSVIRGDRLSPSNPTSSMLNQGLQIANDAFTTGQLPGQLPEQVNSFLRNILPELNKRFGNTNQPSTNTSMPSLPSTPSMPTMSTQPPMSSYPSPRTSIFGGKPLLPGQSFAGRFGRMR